MSFLVRRQASKPQHHQQQQSAAATTEMDRSRNKMTSTDRNGGGAGRLHAATTTNDGVVDDEELGRSEQSVSSRASSHTNNGSLLLGAGSSNNNNNNNMPPSKNEELDLLVSSSSSTSKNGNHNHHHHHTTDVEKGNHGQFSSAKTNPLTSAASVKAVTSCLLYSFCSVSMILCNKSLASSYNDKIEGSLNLLLVVFQAVAAVILVEGCRYAKLVDYPPLNANILKSWAPVNIFFCLMLFTSMASLQHNSVPMVTVFKNVSNICTAGGDYFFYGNRPETLAVAAFGVMLGGAVFAASNDTECTVWGLFWMLANCLTTSGYVLYMKHATQTIQMNKFGMVFVNNVLCVLFLLPAATATGQVAIFLQSSSIHTPDYLVKNMFAGFVGFFLNFASLNCVAAAGPTTYAIVGSLNKVPVALFGYFIFRTPMTSELAFFIAIALCGGFLYSYAKIRSSLQRAASLQEAK